MKPGGSMPHSQRLSNNPYREPDQFNSSYWYYFFKIHSNIVPLWTLDLLKGFVPLGVPVKILKGLLSYSFLATWPAHLNLLDLINLSILGDRYKFWSSLVWSLLYSPFESLLGPNIHLRVLFSNTLCLHISLNVRDHVSQPYSTTGNIIVLYILIFKFLERSLADKSVWTE